MSITRMQEMFEDVKLVIRTRKPREYNGQKKKDNRIKNDILFALTKTKHLEIKNNQ
jgi:hypothetical protein